VVSVTSQLKLTVADGRRNKLFDMLIFLITDIEKFEIKK